MVGYMKLDDGTTAKSFAALVAPGIRRPDDRTRGWHQYDGGPRQYWDASGGFNETFSLNNISHADAIKLNQWWQDLTILVFTEDLDGDPGTTRFARLSPAGSRPFQWMFGQTVDTKYEATVTIVEVSSSSSG